MPPKDYTIVIEVNRDNDFDDEPLRVDYEVLGEGRRGFSTKYINDILEDIKETLLSMEEK